ncbi:NUMOD4 motif-containing HNH endonuclease [Citrobacter portucalensis]|uniref:NUMOD4 motif-containing HNH endonuclease n=1 Tax=Citrobacter portucalensis TaxID=1639133 RepID=UPI00226B4CB8|nr:NUMOD4 motif-containing HNH endonuclease [Citrobacter portucalensis]MCX8976506.1 NUMOD4 motif-containing HNH endonuclease [Citrobacter portucalensis]
MLIEHGENVKDIELFEGLYAITDKGRVYSHSRVITRIRTNGTVFTTLVKGRWMKLDTSTAYLRVRLQKDGFNRLYSVHRLVASAFIDKPDGKDFVNHKDGDKTNNDVNNLEWCTHQENDVHAKDNGLLNPPKGISHPHSKLTNDDVIFIRTSELSGAELADMFSVARSAITKIRKFRAWKHVKEGCDDSTTTFIDKRRWEKLQNGRLHRLSPSKHAGDA